MLDSTESIIDVKKKSHKKSFLVSFQAFEKTASIVMAPETVTCLTS